MSAIALDLGSCSLKWLRTEADGELEGWGRIALRPGVRAGTFMKSACAPWPVTP